MPEAVILRNGTAVRKTGINKPEFNINGYLSSFENNENRKYSYFVKKDFRSDKYEQSAAQSGYYDIVEYALHMAHPKVERYWLSNLIDKHKFKEFEKAVKDDDIAVSIILIEEPYTNFYAKSVYKFKHKESTLNYKKNGILDTSLMGTPERKSSKQGDSASGFFEKHIQFVKDIDDNRKNEFVEAVVKTSLRIGMVENEIFPILTEPSTACSDMKQIQNTITSLQKDWKNSILFTKVSIDKVLEYRKALSDLYSNVFRNQEDIKKGSCTDRIESLMKVLPKNSLLALDVPIKVKALKNLVKNGRDISDAEEEYALKIINSVDIDKQNDVNEFLVSLIFEKFPTGNQSPPYYDNLYSLLYRNIQNYGAITKGITQVLGDSSFNKDNRTRFVYAILFLWSESKYNPYKNVDADGSPELTLFDNGTYDYDKSYKNYAIINYQSEKNFFGIYDDKFAFEFDPWGNGIYWVIDENHILTSQSAMHLYQPITLVHYPSETDLSIQIPQLNGEINGAIPLFFLAYIDQDGDQKDFNQKVGLLVDIVTTVSGVGSFLKLRHLRHLSKLGKVLVFFEAFQASAGLISFILKFVESCDDSKFCKNLKTVLFYIEITSLVTDPIAIAKTKKAARKVVEEGIENGWPSGMLNEINGITPRQKIQEIAGVDIADYINAYISRAKKNLGDKIKVELDFNKSLPKGRVKMDIKRFSTAQKNQFLTIAAGKGLSSEDAMGILHQASRIRRDKIVPDFSELKVRADILIEVRRRDFPYTHNSKIDFDNYAKSKIEPVLDMFALDKNKTFYGGSCITRKYSTNPSNFFDTDWSTKFTKKEFDDYVNLMEQRFNSMIGKNFDGDIVLEGKIKTEIKKMKDYIKNHGRFHRRYIISIEELGDGKFKKHTLDKVLDDQSIFPKETLKTDITPTIEGINGTYPSIKYNFN